MLFINRYQAKSGQSEADEKRMLQLFSQWKPGEGVEIKGWWALPDGSGVSVIEAPSAEAVMKDVAPWGVYLDFNIQPAIEIGKAAEIWGQALAWRESIK